MLSRQPPVVHALEAGVEASKRRVERDASGRASPAMSRAGVGLGPAALLALQQQAGNASVAALVRSVQGLTAQRYLPEEQKGKGKATEEQAPVAAQAAVPDSTLLPVLAKVTKKAEALVNLMTAAEKSAVYRYLTSKADLKLVEQALHFGDKKARKASVEAHRLQIRRKLLEFMAAGGDPKDAITYRNQWGGIAAEHLADLKPVAPQQGAMTMEPLLGGLRVPPRNMNLTQQQVGEIQAVFDDVMKNVMYNSADVPLRFVEQLRKARERDPKARLEDVFNGLVPTDRELFDAAGGADCVGMASLVKRRLADVGIDSYVIGSTTNNYLNQLPSHTSERVGWAEAKQFAVFAHASVVVPYTDQNTGGPRAIHIETGMGPDPKHFSQFMSMAAAQAALSAKKYDTSRTVDPAELAKKHVRCKWRMYLSSDATQGQKVFIDLIEGSIWLSGVPENDVKGLKGLGMPGVLEGTKLRFEEALNQPDREVVLTAGEDEMKLISASDGVELFFKVVAKQFRLPEDTFVREMMWLARNLEEFRQTILLDPIDVIAKVLPLRRDALAARDRADKATGTDPNPAAKDVEDKASAQLQQALAAANANELDEAKRRYQRAIVLYGKVEKARTSRAASSSSSKAKAPEPLGLQ